MVELCIGTDTMDSDTPDDKEDANTVQDSWSYPQRANPETPLWKCRRARARLGQACGLPTFPQHYDDVLASLARLFIIHQPFIPVGPTLAPLYQFYPDLAQPAVPLLSRHSHYHRKSVLTRCLSTRYPFNLDSTHALATQLTVGSLHLEEVLRYHRTCAGSRSANRETRAAAPESQPPSGIVLQAL